MITHHAASALTARASAAADLDPNSRSFANALRLIRRTATATADILPCGLADRLPTHLAKIALQRIPPQRERPCPSCGKCARHKQRPNQETQRAASTRHLGPPTEAA